MKEKFRLLSADVDVTIYLQFNLLVEREQTLILLLIKFCNKTAVQKPLYFRYFLDHMDQVWFVLLEHVNKPCCPDTWFWPWLTRGQKSGTWLAVYFLIAERVTDSYWFSIPQLTTQWEKSKPFVSSAILSVRCTEKLNENFMGSRVDFCVVYTNHFFSGSVHTVLVSKWK